MGKKLKFILLLVCPIVTFAQQVKVDGYFMQDSSKIGERVGYVLKATYPDSVQLIFPDSAYDFSPLVLLEKRTFISSTAQGSTQDSTIYYLSNFSLEPSTFLTLPVVEFNRYDSVTHYPEESELKLRLMLDSIPEQLVFQENNVYQPLKKSINWIMTALVLGGLLLFAGVMYFLFAKQVGEFFDGRREKRKWKQFEKKWKTQTNQLTEKPSIELADEVIGLWKGYMEHLTNRPVKEWTSSETGEKLGDLKIFQSLRAVDMIIYAGESSKSEEATEYLYQVAKEKHQQKLHKIKHERAVV